MFIVDKRKCKGYTKGIGKNFGTGGKVFIEIGFHYKEVFAKTGRSAFLQTLFPSKIVEHYLNLVSLTF